MVRVSACHVKHKCVAVHTRHDSTTYVLYRSQLVSAKVRSKSREEDVTSERGLGRSVYLAVVYCRSPWSARRLATAATKSIIITNTSLTVMLNICVHRRGAIEYGQAFCR
jgi:hypothetical protein